MSLRPVLVLKPVLRSFFEVLVLDGLKDLKNCGLKTKKVLKTVFRPERFWMDEAKFD